MYKRNLCIYPFSKEFLPIVRYQTLLKDYQIGSVVASKTILQAGEDISCLDGGSSINLSVSNDLSQEVIEADELLITSLNKERHTHLDSIIDEFRKRNKNIITINGLESNNKLSKQMPDAKNGIQDINIPVVFVMGLGEYCNKFEIQLSLREHFVSKGYKVSQLGTKSYSELFGFHSLPKFIFQTDLSLPTKIELFNQYVKSLVKDENSDLLIIGVPGSIMKLSNRITNNFAEAMLVISNALQPDISVLSVYYAELSNDYLEKLKQYCFYKFNSKIDYINIANIKLMIQSENYKAPVDFLTVDSRTVGELIETLDMKDTYLFNILSLNGSEFCSHIEKRLQDNREYI